MDMADQTQPVDERYYQLMHQLQAVDFVLVELTLYLDTHRHDMEALNQYNHYAQERWRIAQEFESLFGPLMHFGHSCSGYPWQWADEPWPWQV
jgi:spore coat protein JB